MGARSRSLVRLAVGVIAMATLPAVRAEWPPAGCTNVYIRRTTAAIAGTEGTVVYAIDAAEDATVSTRYPAVFGTTVPLLKCTGMASNGSVMRNKSAPRLLLFSEWFGLSSATVDAALQMVKRGFVVYIFNTYRDHVLPVDLFFTSVDAVTAANGASAFKMAHLAWDIVMEDVRAVVANLTAIASEPVGLLGFSEGAAIALLASQSAAAEGVGATVAFYGSPGAFTGAAPTFFDPAKVDIPVLFLCGELDTFANFSSCDTLRELKAKVGSTATSSFFECGGVGHGFLNDEAWWAQWKAAQNPPRDPFNPTVVTAAYDRATLFFQSHMGSGSRSKWL